MAHGSQVTCDDLVIGVGGYAEILKVGCDGRGGSRCHAGTHAGGSGCGCSAVTLAAMILPKLALGEWKKVLFVPTGALLSKTSFNEGMTIPGIAHGVVLEVE